jgi:hypothetical protein
MSARHKGPITAPGGGSQGSKGRTIRSEGRGLVTKEHTSTSATGSDRAATAAATGPEKDSPSSANGSRCGSCVRTNSVKSA